MESKQLQNKDQQIIILKAQAYDCIAAIEAANKKLGEINHEIIMLSQASAEDKSAA